MVEKCSDEEGKELQGKVDKWRKSFSKSKYFKELSEKEREYKNVIGAFFEYMYFYFCVGPNKWDVEMVEDGCLNIMPGKISAEEDFFRAVGPVLSAFFRFLYEEHILKNGLDFAKVAERDAEDVVKRALNPDNWGMAKRFVMAAFIAGIDITDKEKMNEFLTRCNIGQFLDIMRAKQKGKIDDDVICFCGSGKQYNKCCGLQQD